MRCIYTPPKALFVPVGDNEACAGITGGNVGHCFVVVQIAVGLHFKAVGDNALSPIKGDFAVLRCD